MTEDADGQQVVRVVDTFRTARALVKGHGHEGQGAPTIDTGTGRGAGRRGRIWMNTDDLLQERAATREETPHKGRYQHAMYPRIWRIPALKSAP